jgi:hypothetical protein
MSTFALATRVKIVTLTALTSFALAFVYIQAGPAGAGSFTSGNSSCTGREDPQDLSFRNAIAKNGDGDLYYGKDAVSRVANKDDRDQFTGGVGSSPSYYLLNGCQDHKAYVTGSIFPIRFRRHARFWQTSDSTWSLVASAAHHDMFCASLNLDSSDDFNVARNLLSNFFKYYGSSTGGRYFTWTNRQDRAPSYLPKGCTSGVYDDGITRVVDATNEIAPV